MRRTRVASALIAATAILLLSGCVRFQADLTVTPENTLNGDIVVASIVGDGSIDEAKDRAQSMEEQLLPNLSGADGVTRTEYDEDGYAGSRFTLSNTPLEAINSDSANGSLSLQRDGDTFTFDGAVDLSPDSDDEPAENADESNIEVAITFPGAVTDHNGELEGTTVRWSTGYGGSLDMRAVASAESAGPPAWVWIVGAIVVVAAIGTIIVVGLRRSRRRA
jgi:hypothetical protein